MRVLKVRLENLQVTDLEYLGLFQEEHDRNDRMSRDHLGYLISFCKQCPNQLHFFSGLSHLSFIVLLALVNSLMPAQ